MILQRLYHLNKNLKIHTIRLCNLRKISNSFKSTGLHKDLLCTLYDIGHKTPTKIQEAAIKELLAERPSSFLLASHTGSGKTLAYLLPVIHQIKSTSNYMRSKTLSKRPKALVLAPTRELCEQIYDVANSINVYTKINVSSINSAKSSTAQKTLLNKPNHLVITTPHALLVNHEASRIFFGDVEFLVFDEADTIFTG